MSEDELRMLADLGISRREILSTAGERDCQPDLRREAAILASAEAHRSLYHCDVSGGDPRGAAMRAWNTEANFEMDGAAAKLENHMSGQGHRLGLQRQLQYDHGRKGFGTRFGEESATIAGQSGRHLDHYVPSRPSGGDYASLFPTNNALNASTPRCLSNGALAQDRGRLSFSGPATSRDTNRPRASSPRASGTVRFPPHRQRQRTQNGGDLPVITPKEQAVRALHAAVAQRSAETVPAKTSHTPVSSAGAENSSPDPPSRAAPAAGESKVNIQVRFNQALFVAAHVGEQRETLVKQYPGCVPYVEVARMRLIKEAIDLARSGDQRDISRYIEGHPERKSLVEAAIKIKAYVEQADQGGIESLYATEPSLVQEARKAFAASARRDSATMLDTERLSLGEEPTSFGPEPSNSANVQKDASPIAQVKGFNSPGSNAVPIEEEKQGSSLMRGSLVATFVDVNGKFLGAHHIHIHAPVHGNISLTSRTARYNPRDLIACVEEMAGKMVDRTRGLEGVHLADDGLWVEDDF